MDGKQLVYMVSHIPSLPSQARLSQSGLEPRNLWPTLTSGRSSSSSQPASQSSETCVVGLELWEGILPEEDDEREGDPLHPHPDEGAVEVGLHHAGLALLQLKGVKEPEREVEESQEGDSLYRESNLQRLHWNGSHLPSRTTHLLPPDFLRKRHDFSELLPIHSPWQGA